MSARYTTVGGYPNSDPYYLSPEEEAAMTEHKIITRHVHPPIPSRSWDYCAHFDGDVPICMLDASDEARAA